MRLLLALMALTALMLQACLWDDDTLASEARGLPNVLNAITGRFERNPPLYYEVRLKIAAQRIASNPFDFEAYDNAGVACDRLHRSDEALAWMEKKGAQLDEFDGRKSTMPGESKESRYRYLANLGTFRVHRWARSGADRARIGEVKAARREIAQAIALKPDAHFGREIYQLKILDAILNPPKVEGSGLPALLDLKDSANTYSEAMEGLTGLIVLGDAWESVDLFNTLAQIVKRNGDRSSVAYLAVLRGQELIDAGRRSMLPGAPSDPAELKRLVESAAEGPVVGGVRDKNALRATFRQLRDDADTWQSERIAFMMPRLEAGRHPDTDTHFWDGYTPRPEPDLRDFSTKTTLPWYRRPLSMRSASLLGLASLAVSLSIVRWIRHRRRHRVESKPDQGLWRMSEV